MSRQTSQREDRDGQGNGDPIKLMLEDKTLMDKCVADGIVVESAKDEYNLLQTKSKLSLDSHPAVVFNVSKRHANMYFISGHLHHAIRLNLKGMIKKAMKIIVVCHMKRNLNNRVLSV